MISEPLAAQRPQVAGGTLGLVLAVTLLWGINWPMMKLAVSEIPPWTFRAVCAVGAGAILLLIARLRGETLRLDRRLWLPLAAVSLFGVTAWHMLTAFGLMHMGSGRAAIIAFTMPLWTALLSFVVLRERLSLRQVGGLALGMAGMSVLLAPDLARVQAAPLGAMLMVGAALVWAIATVGVKAWEWHVGVLALSGWQQLVGGIPIVLLGAVLEPLPDPRALSPTAILALLYVVLVALVFCATAYLKIVRTLPATVAALSTLAIPVIGLASSALMLGEPIGLDEVVALGLVLAALALVLLRRRRS